MVLSMMLQTYAGQLWRWLLPTNRRVGAPNTFSFYQLAAIRARMSLTRVTGLDSLKS